VKVPLHGKNAICFSADYAVEMERAVSFARDLFGRIEGAVVDTKSEPSLHPEVQEGRKKTGIPARKCG